MKKNLIKKLVLPMTLLTILASCGSNGTTNKITLTIWEDDTNIDMLTIVADEFSAWYASEYPLAPRVSINFIPESEGKSISNLILDGPAGNGPDIVAFVHDTLGTAVNNGLLAPASYDTQIRQENSSDAIGAFSYQETLYAYPYVAESITLMYDKRQLESGDLESFDSLKATNKKIAFTMSGDGSAYYPFGLFTDANLFGPGGTNARSLNLASPESVDNVYALLHDYSSVIVDTDPDTALALLSTGEVVGVISAPYLWDAVKQNLSSNAGLSILPTINGHNQRPFSGFKGYGVSKHSKNPMIAHLFAKYLTSEDSQYFRHHQKGYLPTFVGSDRIDNAIANSSESSVFHGSLDLSIPMPNILAMADFWSPMQDAMTELWTNRSTVTKAQVQTILETATSNILN